MNKVSLNELAALTLVLGNVSVKELIQNAMKSFAEDNNTKSQDNANICSQAINTFLMQCLSAVHNCEWLGSL